MHNLVEKLLDANKTISSMESCTGGCFANSLTDISGASDVFKFGAVTYSNEFKIKLGVNSETINKYTVYSKEVAREMAHNISIYADSNYGIGITGQLKKVDMKNPFGACNHVYICIYDRDNDQYFDKEFDVTFNARRANKIVIVNTVVEYLLKIIR